MKAIAKKLAAIQLELIAPKGQYNSFGKYAYRSCEDIIKAVKPLCDKNGCVLYLSNDLQEIGGRNYVKATATLIDLESDEVIEVSAHAREESEKKGMDGSQITGASSSYARKYALAGLFCIDNEEDSDETNGRANAPAEQSKPARQSKPVARPKEQSAPQATQAQLTPKDRVLKFIADHNMPAENVAKICGTYRVNTVEELTEAHCKHYINYVRANGGII